MAGETVAFELERFEWGDQRIEVEGRWVGVRGRRFVRPTLTLRGEDDERRVLALLEHKPWDPGDAPWLAAFAWEGENAGFDEAELAVAPGLEVVLPAPRRAPAERKQTPPRRKRYEARPGGSEQTGGAPTRVGDQLAAERARAERLETELGDLRAELDVVTADLELVRTELDAARDERDEARRERETVEAERETAARERDALEPDRDAAVEARAALESEFAALQRERDVLKVERDAAVTARNSARADRDEAVAELDEAIRERDMAVAGRDSAVGERDAAKRAASFASLPRSSIYLSTAERSLFAVWMPRLVAFGIFVAFVVAVLLLLHA